MDRSSLPLVQWGPVILTPRCPAFWKDGENQGPVYKTPFYEILSG